MLQTRPLEKISMWPARDASSTESMPRRTASLPQADGGEYPKRALSLPFPPTFADSSPWSNYQFVLRDTSSDLGPLDLTAAQITPAAMDLLTRRMLRVLTPVVNVVVEAARRHSAQPTQVTIDADDWGDDDDQFVIIVNVPIAWAETDAIWKDIDPGIRSLVSGWPQRDRDFLFEDVRIDLVPTD